MMSSVSKIPFLFVTAAGCMMIGHNPMYVCTYVQIQIHFLFLFLNQ